MRKESDFLKFCECGCGELINRKDRWGRPRRIKYGHHYRGIFAKDSPFKHLDNKGEKHYDWKGGEWFDGKYFRMLKPGHPNSDKRGTVKSHRLVYEQYLSIIFDEDIYIPKEYEIHHINGIKTDNSLINLELLPNHSEHMKLHKKHMTDRICYICGGKTYTDKKGNEYWNKNQFGFICNRCYMKRYNKVMGKRCC